MADTHTQATVVPPRTNPDDPAEIARERAIELLNEDPGLTDPRQLHPAPAAPLPGVNKPLDVDPLPGPTEASEDDDVTLEELEPPGIVDPRSLTPGPEGPSARLAMRFLPPGKTTARIEARRRPD